MALKFRNEKDITTKEVESEKTRIFHVDLDEETKEIDNISKENEVQISSDKISEKTIEENVVAIEEENLESETTEEFDEYDNEDADYYDDDDEYEYVTPNYFKDMFILALVCIIVGVVISFFVFKEKMAVDIRAAYEQNGYMLTNGCTATAEDIKEGKTAYIRGQLVSGTMKDIDTSNATATADDILKGYTAYVDGQLITGTIPTYNGLTTVVPSAIDYKISKGVYLADDIIIRGETNLSAENIRNGVTIFGVRGSYYLSEGPGNE